MNSLTSEWQKKFQVHLYHIDSRKNLTLPSFCNFFQDIAAEHAEQLDFGFDAPLTPLAEKIDFPEELMKTDSFRVRFSDIDLNQHVNNVRYVEWAVDSLPDNILLNQNIVSFSVNFIGEAALGHNISLWKAEADSGHHVSIRNDSTGKELCRVKMGTSDAIH